jgi:hypothetical protein
MLSKASSCRQSEILPEVGRLLQWSGLINPELTAHLAANTLASPSDRIWSHGAYGRADWLTEGN